MFERPLSTSQPHYLQRCLFFVLRNPIRAEHVRCRCKIWNLHHILLVNNRNDKQKHKCRSERKATMFFVEIVFLTRSKCNDRLSKSNRCLFGKKHFFHILIRHSSPFCLLICLFLVLLFSLPVFFFTFEDFASLLFFAYVD